jgi:hypothetical protein
MLSTHPVDKFSPFFDKSIIFYYLGMLKIDNVYSVQ